MKGNLILEKNEIYLRDFMNLNLTPERTSAQQDSWK